MAYTGHSKNQRNRAASPQPQVVTVAGPPLQTCHQSPTATSRYTAPARNSRLPPADVARAAVPSDGATASDAERVTGSFRDAVGVASTTPAGPRGSATGGRYG